MRVSHLTQDLKVAQAELITSCEHNQHLMDDFCGLGIFNDDQLHDLNLCQLYMQVNTMSEIVDGLGKRLLMKSSRLRPVPTVHKSLKKLLKKS
jgi:hypothetical protein